MTDAIELIKRIPKELENKIKETAKSTNYEWKMNLKRMVGLELAKLEEHIGTL